MYSIDSKGLEKKSKGSGWRNFFKSNSKEISGELRQVSDDLMRTRSRDLYFASVLDFIPQLVYGRDRQGRYTLVNRAFADFAEMSPEEIVGKTDVELNIFLNADQIVEIDDMLFENGARKFIPLEPYTDRFGSLYWFQTVKTPMMDDTGEVAELIIVSSDVTTKVDNEQKLSKSELRYRSIFENNYSGIIAIDKDLNILNKNKSFDNLINKNHTLSTGGDLKEYLRDEDRKDLLDLMNGMSTRNYESFDIDLILTNSEGKEVETICFVKGLYDELQHFTEAVVTFQDVTFENEQKRKVEDSELRFRTLVENAPEAIMLLDVEKHVYIDANRGALKLFGYSKEAIINKDMDLISHAEVNSTAEQTAEDYLKRALDGESVVFDWTIKNSDDVLIPCEVRLIRMPYTDRTIVRVSILDITERKQAEELLNNEKEKLQQSNKELIDLNFKLGNQTQQLQEFAYIASHNLRAPAGNIRALLDFYTSEPSGDNLTILLDKLDIVAEDLMDTINDLAEVVKIKNEVSKETTELSLDKVMAKTIDSLSETIKDKKADVQYDFGEYQPIYAPKSYIDSVVLNLVSNALKYSSPDRKPEIKVTAALEEDKLVLHFRDNGLGLDLKRFGKKLFGLRKTFHRNKDSRGVGLFITKAQIEAIGGDIKVESEVDKGTTFSIVLPLSILKKPQ